MDATLPPAKGSNQARGPYRGMNECKPMMDQADELLAGRLRDHDPAAFSALYDRYAPAVFALAVHRLGSPSAGEVVQDVFLRLWHRSEQFNPQRGSFATWLMAIARHRIADELARRSQAQRLSYAYEIDALLAAAEDPAPGIEQQAAENERGRAVLAALRRIPSEQRQVLVLGYFAGMSQSVMSEHLGLPLGTVKKRVQLGMQKLRIILDDHRPGAGEERAAEIRFRGQS